MSIPAELTLVLESFDRNGRVNRALLSTLTMEDLTYGDNAGGYNIGQHLADLIGFRPDWLSHVSPPHAEGLPDVIDGASPTWLGVGSIDELKAAFDAGDAALREAVTSAVRDGRSFERVYESNPAHLLQHCIVHDSHHRGQVLALLRQAGRPEEARKELEGSTWSIWRE